LLGLQLPQLEKITLNIERLAAAATRQKSGKFDQKFRVVAAATRKKGKKRLKIKIKLTVIKIQKKTCGSRNSTTVTRVGEAPNKPSVLQAVLVKIVTAILFGQCAFGEP